MMVSWFLFNQCVLRMAIIFICVAIFVLFLVFFYRRFAPKFIAGGVCKSEARMEGKTVLITGANSGIGKETALDLAKRGARVIMACRDLTKGRAALKEIVEASGNSEVILKCLDLASLKSIREFAEDVNKSEGSLHVLINNAGVAYFSEHTKTVDGFGLAMGVNHLGHFLLTNLLVELLKKSAPSRIVVVSSVAHQALTKAMQLDNITGVKWYWHSKYSSYGQSKLANILFARELAKRLAGSGVTANSLHPGTSVDTGIFYSLPSVALLFKMPMNLFCKTNAQAAQTSIHAAVCEEVAGQSGLYFSDCEPVKPSRFAQDDGVAKKLWELSADIVGLENTI